MNKSLSDFVNKMVRREGGGKIMLWGNHKQIKKKYLALPVSTLQLKILKTHMQCMPQKKITRDKERVTAWRDTHQMFSKPDANPKPTDPRK